MMLKKLAALLYCIQAGVAADQTITDTKEVVDDYINILYVTDHKYVEQTNVMMRADMYNSNKEDKYRFIIAFDDSINSENQCTFNLLKGDYPKTDIRFVNISGIMRTLTEANSYSWPVIIYAKIFADKIATILENEENITINKLLYKDADVLTLKDLKTLYMSDLSNKSMGVVNTGAEGKKHYNAGVILYNIERMRITGFSNEIWKALINGQKKVKEGVFTEEHALVDAGRRTGEILDLPLRFNFPIQIIPKEFDGTSESVKWAITSSDGVFNEELPQINCAHSLGFPKLEDIEIGQEEAKWAHNRYTLEKYRDSAGRHTLKVKYNS